MSKIERSFIAVAVGAGVEASTGVFVGDGVAVGTAVSVAFDEGFCEIAAGLDFGESKAGKAT